MNPPWWGWILIALLVWLMLMLSVLLFMAMRMVSEDRRKMRQEDQGLSSRMVIKPGRARINGSRAPDGESDSRET